MGSTRGRPPPQGRTVVDQSLPPGSTPPSTPGTECTRAPLLQRKELPAQPGNRGGGGTGPSVGISVHATFKGKKILEQFWLLSLTHRGSCLVPRLKLSGLSPLLIKLFPQRLGHTGLFASATGSSSVQAAGPQDSPFLTVFYHPPLYPMPFPPPIRLCCGFLMISPLFNHSGEIGPKIANKRVLTWMGSRPARTTSSDNSVLIPGPAHAQLAHFWT